jgi:hypothetical protein
MKHLKYITLGVLFLSGLTLGLVIGFNRTPSTSRQCQLILDLATEVRHYNSSLKRQYEVSVENLNECARQNAQLLKR